MLEGRSRKNPGWSGRDFLSAMVDGLPNLNELKINEDAPTGLYILGGFVKSTLPNPG